MVSLFLNAKIQLSLKFMIKLIYIYALYSHLRLIDQFFFHIWLKMFKMCVDISFSNDFRVNLKINKNAKLSRFHILACNIIN
jgi:hypothetical protein